MPAIVKTPEMPVIQGGFSEGRPRENLLTIGMLAPLFLEWARYERRRAPWTVRRYREALGWVIRDVGDQGVAELHLGHLLTLRRKMEERGCGEARVAAILHALRSFLRFCGEVLRVPALDYRQVRVPRIPRREVVYLTTEEVQGLLEEIIPAGRDWEVVSIARLRFRALVEVLLGTGARISEVLSLNRQDISFERKEAKIIGKGNKQRVLFFTERAIEWLRRYFSRRGDEEDAVFVTHGELPRRMSYDCVKNRFQHYRTRMGLTKKLSAHILRHTMATTLLFKGCPIGHIKDILGHERLDTTCRYYLGVDQRAAKEAHAKFLHFD